MPRTRTPPCWWPSQYARLCIAWRPRRVAQAGALLLALVTVSLLVFAGPTALFSFQPLAYTVFPLVIWAALRFGQPAATQRTFVASGLAISGTVGGFTRAIGVAGEKMSLRADAPRPLFCFYL